MIIVLHQYKKNPVDTPTVFFQNYFEQLTLLAALVHCEIVDL